MVVCLEQDFFSFHNNLVVVIDSTASLLLHDISILHRSWYC